MFSPVARHISRIEATMCGMPQEVWGSSSGCFDATPVVWRTGPGQGTRFVSDVTLRLIESSIAQPAAGMQLHACLHSF